MPDRERVVKAWEIFRDSNPYEICSGREFRAIREPEYCMGQMIEDTIALLKEQEAVEPKKESDGNPEMWASWWYVCGNCGEGIDWHDRYCWHCGRAVKWD